jgi:tetratricopeptide (TPR) repeat protein
MKHCRTIVFPTLIVSLVLLFLCPPTRANLAAYWPFDGDPRDRVGGRTALLQGAARYEAGYLGEAVQLHGGPDYVELPVGELIATLTSCTIALWVNPSPDNDAWYRIFTFGLSPTAHMDLTGKAVPPNALQLYIVNGDDQRWLPAWDVLPEGWHHIAVSIDAKEQRCVLYLDGVAVASEAKLSPRLVPNQLGRTTENCLGSRPYSWGSHFKGGIDEVAIFDRALTEAEMRLLYQSSAAAFLYEDATTLVDAVQQATQAMTAGNSGRATLLLKEHLNRYAAFASKAPSMAHGTLEAPMGAIYTLLAEAQEASGGSTEDVVTLLVKSMQFAARNEPYVRSLLSLFQRVPRDRYTALVRQSLEANGLTPHHLSGIAQTFHAGRQWDAFEAFLAVVLEQSAEPSAFAAAAQVALETTPWSARLKTYLATVPQLGHYCAAQRVQHAQALMQEQRYSEAAAVYRVLIEASSVPAEKMHYEFELVRCAFLRGHDAEAVSLTDAYLNRYATLPVRQLKGALLLKASALLAQRQVDGAIQTCLQAIAVPPETEDDREAHYLIGYCQMLQGREEQAKETFGSLVAAYPGSPQAGRSRLLLGRIGHASQ